jgi:hypothetical protein
MPHRSGFGAVLFDQREYRQKCINLMLIDLCCKFGYAKMKKEQLCIINVGETTILCRYGY